MRKGSLKKLNKSKSAEGVELAIAAAGFFPFEEGDVADLSVMTIFKAEEKHTPRRKKEGGIYVKLQSFTSPEGAENFDFIALSADRKLARRGEDGKKIRPLYCKLFIKRLT